MEINNHYDYEGENKYTVVNIDRRKFKSRFRYNQIKLKSEFINELEKYGTEQSLNSKPIIFSLYPSFDFARRLINDLIGGETFNVIPSKVKETEDAATPAELKRDGSGLATTLYAMKKSKAKLTFRRRVNFGIDQIERRFCSGYP